MVKWCHSTYERPLALGRRLAKKDVKRFKKSTPHDPRLISERKHGLGVQRLIHWRHLTEHMLGSLHPSSYPFISATDPSPPKQVSAYLAGATHLLSSSVAVHASLPMCIIQVGSALSSALSYSVTLCIFQSRLYITPTCEKDEFSYRLHGRGINFISFNT